MTFHGMGLHANQIVITVKNNKLFMLKIILVYKFKKLPNRDITMLATYLPVEGAAPSFPQWGSGRMEGEVQT